MEEFIFGTLATDQLKLMHHRAARRGLQHARDVEPRNPLPGQPITLTVWAGVNLTADAVACYYTTDGTQPAGSRGVAAQGQVARFEPAGVEWDTAAWGYRQRWTVTLPAQAEGVIARYCISAWSAGGDEVYADWPQVRAASEEAAAAYFNGKPVPDDLQVGDPSRPHVFTLSVDRLTPPTWAREAVIYHVFVDRFFPGGGRDWTQTDDLNGFCGGTLWGVAEKLDYIVDLGATCIWLSPVFCSETHHGYDVVDYGHVEPRLGGDAALKALVQAAHKRGLRVILDIALNHLSHHHPYFVDAHSNPDSPYRNWFIFDDSELGYRSFFGVESMPKLNVTTPAARQWLIDVGRYWLREYDVDGYRLDVADGPGPDFWTDFYRACKQEKPDSLCFGEVVDAPDIQREYVGRLDGLLDFHLCYSLRRAFAQERISADELARFIERHTAYFPPDFLLLSFVDNHDMDRFTFTAKGQTEALRQAAALQFSLPNVPVIYYGTEIGLTQAVSAAEGFGLHVNRVLMRWDAVDGSEMLTFYKALIRARRGS